MRRLAGRYLPEHPKMQDINARLENGKRRLIAERTKVLENIRNEYDAKLSEERSFSAQLQAQKAAANDLDKKGGDYNILKRKADSERAVCQTLLTQQKELAVVANSRSNNVQVMDRAEVPRRRRSLPNPTQGLDHGDHGRRHDRARAWPSASSISTTPSRRRKTSRGGSKLPLLGLVPAVRGDRRAGADRDRCRTTSARRSDRCAPRSSSRAARESTRVIAVTSSQPLEGKTTTACNLAMALALGGSRVLLIDADMRRPGLHKTHGAAERHRAVAPAASARRACATPCSAPASRTCVAITAGRTPPNPSELLVVGADEQPAREPGARAVRLGHRSTRRRCSPSPTPSSSRSRVSGVVFVVGSEMTRRVHAERALETLQSGHPQSVTVVAQPR